MTKRARHALWILLLFAGPAFSALEVRKALPMGEIARLEQANEVRVIFSAPIVALGRIPEPVNAPFFRIDPPVPGSFRWSGTDTLVFTADKAFRFPFATKYTVTIDGATNLAGERLALPYVFSFTTPTVRLVRTNWYRVGRRYDGQLMLGLTFNQPVDTTQLSGHVALRYVSHSWDPPVLAPAAVERLRAVDPRAVDDFNAKVAATAKTVSRTDTVRFTPAAQWDVKAFPKGPGLAVFVTDDVPPTDAWIEVRILKSAKGVAGPETPREDQTYVLRLPPTFFVRGFRCEERCEPDDYNPLTLSSIVRLSDLRRSLQAADVTDPAKETPVRKGKPLHAAEEGEADEGEGPPERGGSFSLSEVGLSLQPARRYAVRIGRHLLATDGQSLGYTWLGLVENARRRAYVSFGAGHGVWESAGGPLLPYTAQNLTAVDEWKEAVSLETLVPTLQMLEQGSFTGTPATGPRLRRLSPVPDKRQAYGFDFSTALGARGFGLVWAALKPGAPISGSSLWGNLKPVSTLVQVTNLGLSVKDSPLNTLVLVTRLDDGRPVEGAHVSIRTLDNTVFGSALTDAHGLARIPNTPLRDHQQWWKLAFVVTAEKDGDVAYLPNTWFQGIEPWSFGFFANLDEAKPLLRGAAFADRGVYKLGEEVRVKVLLRSDTAEAMVLLPAGTEAEVTTRNTHGETIDTRRVTLNEWNGADFALKVPEDGPLGSYSVSVAVGGQKNSVSGSFLVAAYRRPDFRVDATLGAGSTVAGAALEGTVAAKYLFGAPMAGRPVEWTYTRTPVYEPPHAVTEAFPAERFAFLDEESLSHRTTEFLQRHETSLDGAGKLALSLETALKAGAPFRYTLEGEVTDLARQKIAGRASVVIHAAPWYVGVRRAPFFADVSTGVDTEVVTPGLDGKPVSGVKVRVTLKQIQWQSVRHAEGDGFYAWESKRKEVPRGSWDVVSEVSPAPLHVPVPAGGYYVLTARASDAEGRFTQTVTSFYALGPGYTAWQRYDHNRIDLVPERKTYKPGDTARILVQSPWEKATALLTTEREGVRTSRVFALSSTQETVTILVTEADIPNVFVSVLLVKGRTGTFSEKDASDPGKPSFRLGYAELKVEDARKRLSVSVTSDKEEYRPGGKARVSVRTRDANSDGAPSEVTLWAVDYGVLSLTGYRTPDVLPSVWVAKSLQVMNEDSRQMIVSRRVLTPKGPAEGGGGGVEDGPGDGPRKDFRALAFWLGSLETDAAGNASAEVTLPESLTSYRIMAVAGDKSSRFGFGDREIRVNKPVLLKPAFPRFLAMGDKAFFGSVLFSQLKQGGTAVVTLKSLDPEVLEVAGDAARSVEIGPSGSSEIRFDVNAKAMGRARLRMSVRLLNESDAFEDTLPVRVLASPEVVAAYGQADPKAREELEIPKEVVPGYGGLHVELSSTALVGLGEGARYLVDYPYGCAEQRASAALALLLVADLGEAFHLPGIEPAELKGMAQATLRELESFQCANGGFTYWKGKCAVTSPYLTSYVLHVAARGAGLGYSVKPRMLEAGYEYLQSALAGKPPVNEGWSAMDTAWQAFAIKVLAEGGRNVDSHSTRLFGYVDRMPVFALGYLHDAMAKGNARDPRLADLVRRMTNAVLPEGGHAHVEELNDPELFWVWSSNTRSTAIVLRSLVAARADTMLLSRMVRWMMTARKNGRWGNTQENAVAMEALVDYYRAFEAEVPDFTAVVSLARDTLMKEAFRGRSDSARAGDIAMPRLLQKGGPGARLPLTFEREGKGTLHYVARLAYVPAGRDLAAMDQGIRIARAYAVQHDDTAGDPAQSFRAGDLVKVTLRLNLTKERRWVAVTDPLPAGFEPVESWFTTTAQSLTRDPDRGDGGSSWRDWWRKGGFDHVERHDDRVLLFATRLGEGEHVFSYLARATTSGTFHTAPARAEEMYSPEVFGRTASVTVEVGR